MLFTVIVYNIVDVVDFQKTYQSIIDLDKSEFEIIALSSDEELNSVLTSLDISIKIINSEVLDIHSESTGDYILFLSSGDYLDADYLRKVNNKLINNYDLVAYKFYRFNENGVETYNERDWEDESPFDIVKNPQFVWGDPYISSVLINRKLIEKINTLFKCDNSNSIFIFYQALFNAETIIWVSSAIVTNDSIKNPLFSKNLKDVALLLIKIMDTIGNHPRHTPDVKFRTHAKVLSLLNKNDFEIAPYLKKSESTTIFRQLMSKLDSNVIMQYFSNEEKRLYLKFLSPTLQIKQNAKRVLIYNWLPFDNPWNWGGGVTIYCRNIISEIVNNYPDLKVTFLSSGFAYDSTRKEIFVRKINNIFGNRVDQYEIVNSPVPAEQRWLYVNPLVALSKPSLVSCVDKFLELMGPFDVIHFNNIEGLSLDVLDLKKKYANTKFLFSIHNYVPLCVNGGYYMRHKHCICNPNHTGKDCYNCTRADIRRDCANATYDRGTYNQDPSRLIPKEEWLSHFGFHELDNNVSYHNILDFAKTATDKLNRNCDKILAVSKRVFDIAKDNGFDAKKMVVSYIGTKVADNQIRKSNCTATDGIKLIFLGSDLFYEEKGYPFLIKALKKVPPSYSSKIDLVLTVKKYDASMNFLKMQYRSVTIQEGYTHNDLPRLLNGCNLSVVPVVWEDNLPQIAIESVAYGVPVLASDAGGASELCTDNKFKFKSGDIDSFINKITYFIDHPSEIDDYWKGHKGLVTLKQHISELLELYGIHVDEKITLSREDYSALLTELSYLTEWNVHNISTSIRTEIPEIVSTMRTEEETTKRKRRLFR